MVLTEDFDIKQAEKAKNNLRHAYLVRASLEYINLCCGDLHGAKLNDAYLLGANLMAANLTKANLNGANLMWAKLNNSDLRETTFTGTILNGADLSFAQNLTQRQLEYAIMDKATKLPEYLLEES